MDLIYLDHNSTTPVLDEVAAAMAEWQTLRFGNPSSQHLAGRRARQALDNAREGIGRILGADLANREPDRVIFTSGGTEANNLALFGLAVLHDPHSRPGEAIVSLIEHPSIAAPVEFLKRRGWRIHTLGVSPNGVVDIGPLDELLSERTRFVSVMLANNETGVLQPVREIARRCASLGVPMHTDAAQIVGKLPVDFRSLGVSLMTVAPHKFHGPIGIGALLVRHDVSLEPMLFGGFQQAGLRPGTEAVALAVGLHAALVAWQREGAVRSERLRRLRDRLEAGSAAGYAGEVVVNGSLAERLPNTSNLAFGGLERQALLMALDLEGVACSTGSACASGSSEPSPVLAAMGCSKSVLAGSLRFSLGATTTDDEIGQAIECILRVCARIAESVPAARIRPARSR
ncbi:MAG TPA: cysteine desulfurase family protein [Pirellulales bacterium]|jgi:cysteine desulfurase|nr:cysteine desulfurase family protein [Pirellulales bacterium]